MTPSMTCRQPPTRAARLLAAVGAALFASAIDAAPVASAPQTESRGVRVAEIVRLRMPDGAAARRIALGAPATGEAAAVQSYNAGAAGMRGPAGRPMGQPLAIGFGREMPAASRTLSLADLAWQDDPAGGRTARVEIASPGAAAMRVSLALSDPAAKFSVRFAGAGAAADAFGAYTAAAIADATARGGRFWSPVLEGDVAVVEVHAEAGAALEGVALRIPRVAHMLVGGKDLQAPATAIAKATGIGAAGGCNVDVACLSPQTQAATDLMNAVVKMTFVNSLGRTFLCTGTLLGDSTSTTTPYLLTANHCLDTPDVARTLNTYWFYSAVGCNSKISPQYVQLTGGAVLLGRSFDTDWSIVRLNDTPPAGAKFAAWRAEALASGTPVVSIHHPEGDLTKWSRGTVTGSRLIDDGSVFAHFTEVVWSQGVTEGGSSGGALATLAGAGGFYEVRGGLYGGQSSCTLQNLPDYFSDLRNALPLMREFLTPDYVETAGRVVAVEFYHRGLDHYFLSTNPVEIAKLDSGLTVGWERTGLRFLVYDRPTAGASPVCRFYRAPAFGDSHFYSADPGECAATAAAHPVDWVYESPAVFYAALPDKATGACAAGTAAIYRYFNRATTNHRYTTEIIVRNGLDASSLWIAEGYGPGPYYPIMCAATP
ncbi:MAG: serine protease [Burkholderiales bacterium]